MNKFKLWDTHNNKMILPEDEEKGSESDYPTLLAIGLHGLPIAIDEDSFKDNIIIGWNVDHNRIILQSTGLYDINNTEIYEGDIVKYDNSKLGKIQQASSGLWSIDDKHALWAIESEIVGNIYEDDNVYENIGVI